MGLHSALMTSFNGACVDDLMREVLQCLLDHKEKICPTRGSATEMRGIRIELTDPLARLSRTQARGKLFSCLGELLWYLAGSNSAAHIKYYVSKYHIEETNDGTIPGAYGMRLFGADQRLKAIVGMLKNRPDSRQAVIPLLEPADFHQGSTSLPCTSTLQFMLRTGRVDLVTSMRSNDAYLGLPHDVFAFTMIQELVARALEKKVGTYIHMVGSLHLYDANREAAQKFLDEGIADIRPMEPMPEGDPWCHVDELLAIEESLRLGQCDITDDMDESYWADISHLLRMYAMWKNDLPLERINTVRKLIQSDVYDVFLNDKFGIVAS